MPPLAPRPGRRPPRGVPRWLWPPPGAEVNSCVIAELVGVDGVPRYAVREGREPALRHLRALRWLLDEHPHGSLPASGCPFEGQVRLAIARTRLPGGRVGHAYALNDGPLGAPSGDGARGVLRRYIAHRLEA